MTIGAVRMRHLQNLLFLHPPTFLSWIPAFAGMTTKRKQAACHPDSPFAMPDKCLNAAPAVMPEKAGIPLPSFRRRPESSGVDKPFPRSGNDNPIPRSGQSDAHKNQSERPHHLTLNSTLRRPASGRPERPPAKPPTSSSPQSPNSTSLDNSPATKSDPPQAAKTPPSPTPD